MSLEEEITELCTYYPGLEPWRDETKGVTVVRGVLNFEASYEELESIQDWFEIELVIPNNYPETLPEVFELQGKVVSNYEHLYQDGSFCLAVPIAARLAFRKEPNLLGFINNLVVSYLYSYCYWRKHGSYPFNDSPHGHYGYLDYYEKLFGVKLSPALFAGLERIVKYGYRGHHPCPCGSGKIIRKCHKQVVADLSQEEIQLQLGLEIEEIKKAILSDRRS